jgi:hypothetical protein
MKKYPRAAEVEMATKEQQLLECWRELPPDAQDQVLQLAQSLQPEPEFAPQTPLGKKLWEIRQRAIAEGMKLLTEEELEQELAERRGGYREP